MFKKQVYAFLTLFALVTGCTLNQQPSSQCVPSLSVTSDISRFPLPDYIDNMSSGSMNAITVQGDYAYTNIGNWFAVLEIFNKENPKLVGCLLLPGFVSGIHIVESHAYVTTGGQSQTWHVIDVFDPSHPVWVAGGKNHYTYIPQLALAGSYLYISTPDMGLEIFDITNPSTPVEAGYYSSYDFQSEGNLAPFQFQELLVSNQYIYIAAAYDNNHKLLVMDISNPLDPYLVGNYQAESKNFISHITIHENYAYVATYLSGDWFGNNPQVEIHILDISNPGNMFEVGKYTSNNGVPINQFSIKDHYVYVAYSIRDIAIVDVTNPIAPIEVGYVTIPPTGTVTEIFIAENWLYIAGGAVGLQIIDITDPFKPLGFSRYTILGTISKFQVKGNIAHVVTLGEWRMVNIANPDKVELLGSFGREILGQVTSVIAKDNFVYLSFLKERESGIKVLDITNPNFPIIINTYLPSGLGFNEITSSGNILYLSDSIEIIVLDISNPLNIVQIGSYQFEHKFDIFSDIQVSNDFIIGVGIDGLRFLDISNPIEPVEISPYNKNTPFSQIAVSDEYLYALTSPDIVTIFDTRNLPELEEVTTYQFPTKVIDLSVDREKLYIAMDSGDLLIFQTDAFIP